MKKRNEYWTIQKLQENFNNIEFPEFQRESTVWNLEKKQLLIDSILRDIDISSIYFYENENGGFDCIDGRQRLNAMLSYIGINDADEEHNEFNLNIINEIYDDEGRFNAVQGKRYKKLDHKWKIKIDNYQFNIVIISDIDQDEELNLLFLRLQVASVLNAGEKLHAMKGFIRDWIFHDIINHPFFKKIKIYRRRYAKEQVAAQIALNFFSKKNNGTFHRSRYIDLQDFFKEYKDVNPDTEKLIEEMKKRFDFIEKKFKEKLEYLNNRAITITIFLYINELIEQEKQKEVDKFVEFFTKFLKTLKWQIPKGVKMHEAYHDFLKFQSNISQAAGEKTAIERRHDFIDKYFYHYKKNNILIGDDKYKESMGRDPNNERDKVLL